MIKEVLFLAIVLVAISSSYSAPSGQNEASGKAVEPSAAMEDMETAETKFKGGGGGGCCKGGGGGHYRGGGGHRGGGGGFKGGKGFKKG